MPGIRALLPLELVELACHLPLLRLVTRAHLRELAHDRPAVAGEGGLAVVERHDAHGRDLEMGLEALRAPLPHLLLALRQRLDGRPQLRLVAGGLGGENLGSLHGALWALLVVGRDVLADGDAEELPEALGVHAQTPLQLLLQLLLPSASSEPLVQERPGPLSDILETASGGAKLVALVVVVLRAQLALALALPTLALALVRPRPGAAGRIRRRLAPATSSARAGPRRRRRPMGAPTPL
mmetsp:Transcript_72482/g.209831  ORF Transcript_72482/g.209831 Transcript_72482/m.209831 type:complete len:239 (-) Transcript_72482:113-829(-)